MVDRGFSDSRMPTFGLLANVPPLAVLVSPPVAEDAVGHCLRAKPMAASLPSDEVLMTNGDQLVIVLAAVGSSS
jgi:hypothetical protein